MSSEPEPLSSDVFAAHYARPKAPWDIGRPQAPFVAAADAIGPRVLDIGCGTGDLAIWLAERGRAVTGIDLAAGRTVELKPGGYHVMLMDLKQTVKAGDSVPLTLVFEDAGKQRFTQTLQAPVKALGQGGAAPMGHGHHKH